MLTVTLICRDAVRKEIGFKLQKPRLPANTFGRHCSIELYWLSQYTAALSTVITTHQGYSYAATGWRSKTKAITVATAPKITRIILSLRGGWCSMTDSRIHLHPPTMRRNFGSPVKSSRKNSPPPVVVLSAILSQHGWQRNCPKGHNYIQNYLWVPKAASGDDYVFGRIKFFSTRNRPI